MIEHKRIILVGPAAAGKDYIRNKFREKGYDVDVSYTTRPPRKDEVDGIDYKFVTEENFDNRIDYQMFYEFVQHGKYYYGTGLSEWELCDVFIMETEGVNSITPNDRKDCLVIYVNTPYERRIARMLYRNWNKEKIEERIKIDEEKFKDFKDYDLQISSETQI